MYTPSTMGAVPRTHTTTSSPRALGRLAGILYLVIAVAAIFAQMVVPTRLDAALSAQPPSLAAAESLVRLALGSEFVVLLSEVALSVILYVLFRPAGQTPALLAAAFRLIMTAIHAANLGLYGAALLLLRGDLAAALEPQQVPALVRLLLAAHHFGFEVGIVFFVPHLLVLGYLVLRSGYVPRVLGVLLLVAAGCYLVDTTALLLLHAYDATPAVLALPIVVAEIAFPIWLVAKGVRAERAG
jgi:hypothetical protein